MDIRGQGSIPLTRTDENLTPREIEQKAAELAYFLRVPIEVFWEIENQNVHSIKENVYERTIKRNSFYGLYAYVNPRNSITNNKSK